MLTEMNFSRPGGTRAAVRNGGRAQAPLKRRAIAGLSRWDDGNGAADVSPLIISLGVVCAGSRRLLREFVVGWCCCAAAIFGLRSTAALPPIGWERVIPAKREDEIENLWFYK
jgi:hypothetical protein